MPSVLIQIDQRAAGIDFSTLAADIAAQYAGLTHTIAQWQNGTPDEFKVALSELARLRAPEFEIGGTLGPAFATLLAALQNDLGALVAQLESEVATLPAHISDELLAAYAPLLERIQMLHGLFENDWSCGLMAEFGLTADAGGSGAAQAEGGSAGGGGASAAPTTGAAPSAAAAGAISAAQLSSAQARIDTLPTDLSVPALLRWVHQRVGTFRPGYFSLRSLPILDDIRDPLDTLVRWDDASAATIEAELQHTVATLAALIHSSTSAHFAAALPAPALSSFSALPSAAIGAAAESWVAALEALARALQAGDAATLASGLAAAHSARAALLAHHDAIAASSTARVELLNGLATLPGALDAGICRSLVLLLPRASFADLTAGIGPLHIPALPADPFAVVSDLIGQVSEHLNGLLDVLDVSAVSTPVTAALTRAHDAVEAVEHSLAQLTEQASTTLDEAHGAIAALDLDALRTQAEDALEAALGELNTRISDALTSASAALGEALTTAAAAMDAIDPESLTEPIRDALEVIASLTNEASVQALMGFVEQLEQLAQTIAGLSFEPAADGLVGAIAELNTLIRSIDVASLPAPAAALIDEAIALLPQSLLPITEPLVVNLDSQIEGSPIDLLEQVKALPEQVRARLLALSPRAVLEPLLSKPFEQAVGDLEDFSPLQWLQAVEQPLAELRARLRQQLDVAALLADASRAHAAVLIELERVRPTTLLEPLGTAVAQALAALDDALPAAALGDDLGLVLKRIQSFQYTLDTALDIADHLVHKLDGLGDASAGFDTWITGILAKLPETATGALASALTALRASAHALRPDQLASDWASAHAPLTTALAQVDASERLTRLALARTRILSTLGALPAAERDAIAAFFADPQTRSAGAGLSAFASLDRALVDADTTLGTHFSQLGERFPHADGPLAALLPDPGASVRAWVRAAIVRQLGMPVVSFVDALKLIAGLVSAASVALRALVAKLNSKLDDLLAAPQALAELLGKVCALQARLGGLHPATYAQELDGAYSAVLDQFRALDPRALVTALSATRDQLLDQITLDGVLPLALRGQLEALHGELVTKIGALDPDALLLTPLDARYRETIEPLLGALDVSATLQLIIDWLHSLPQDLRTQIGRVDVAYAQLLASAPSGRAAGGSVTLRVGS